MVQEQMGEKERQAQVAQLTADSRCHSHSHRKHHLHHSISQALPLDHSAALCLRLLPTLSPS